VLVSPAEPPSLRVGSLFSGIGGLDLGLERAGMTTIWQSEIGPFACRVLARHWPHVPNLGDVTTIDWSTVERPDLICGGFPCQDISSAHTVGPNSRSGLEGPKSGLWRQFSRCVAALRPRWVLVENVASGWTRWVPGVRGSLDSLGYASVPVEVSARAFGAPHLRRRILVVAHPYGDSEPLGAIYGEAQVLPSAPIRSGYWRADLPGVLRVDDGVPRRMDRRRALGNAVVPQMAEWIGRIIVEVERARQPC
jgi:DNA (cytosine-5)-methyltransferase 1